eukprot:747500-Hanusia_phi.AAC.3
MHVGLIILAGKEFFQKKKIPLTVKLGKNNLGDQFKRLLNSSPFFLVSSSFPVYRAGRKVGAGGGDVLSPQGGTHRDAAEADRREHHSGDGCRSQGAAQRLGVDTSPQHQDPRLHRPSHLQFAVSTITATPEKSGKKRKSTGKQEEDEADRPKKVKKGAEKAKEEAEEAAEEDSKGQASAKKEVKQAAKPEAAKTPKSVQKKKISTPKSTAKASAKKVKAAS